MEVLHEGPKIPRGSMGVWTLAWPSIITNLFYATSSIAAIKVVGGPINVDQEIIKSNYQQLDAYGEPNKDQKLFNKIMSHIDRYTRSRLNVPTDRVHRPI